eukprot:1087745-Rhodomonas_salina.1
MEVHQGTKVCLHTGTRVPGYPGTRVLIPGYPGKAQTFLLYSATRTYASWPERICVRTIVICDSQAHSTRLDLGVSTQPLQRTYCRLGDRIFLPARSLQEAVKTRKYPGHDPLKPGPTQSAAFPGTRIDPHTPQQLRNSTTFGLRLPADPPAVHCFPQSQLLRSFPDLAPLFHP